MGTNKYEDSAFDLGQGHKARGIYIIITGSQAITVRPDPACCPEVETGWRILILAEDKLMSITHQQTVQCGWGILIPYEDEPVLITHGSYCSKVVADSDPS